MSDKKFVKAVSDLLYELRLNMTSVTRYVRHRREDHPKLTEGQFIDQNQEYKTLAAEAVDNILNCINRNEELDRLLKSAIENADADTEMPKAVSCIDGSMKERIVNVLKSKPYGYSSYEEMAEYLLSKCVFAPPCEIGDEIYVIPSKVNYELNKLNGLSENNRVYRQKVEEIRIYKDRTYMLFTCGGLFAVNGEFFGHTWFLDKVKAEEELRKRG